MPCLLSVVGEAINATRNGEVLHAEQGLCWSVTQLPRSPAGQLPATLSLCAGYSFVPCHRQKKAFAGTQEMPELCF